MVRGGGEMATAAARLLFLAGFRVVVLERPQPLAVRRRVSFAQAVGAGACEIEGVRARRVEADEVLHLAGLARADEVPVVVDPEGRLVAALPARVVVDARMRKAASDDVVPAGVLRVGLGPGHVAGHDVDVVVETQRGPTLGQPLWSGSALPDTGEPAPVLGERESRVVRAPDAGVFVAVRSIGETVARGDVLGHVAGTPVMAATSGLVRGLVADGVAVAADEKLGDVDPRGAEIDVAAISDKARTVAAGVLEAVLVGLAAPPSNE